MPQPKVLITRPLGGTTDVAQAVERIGYQAIVAPLLEIVPLPFTLPVAPFDTLLLTSTTALRFLPSDFNRRTPVYTVGETTCAATLAAGFETVRCIGQTVEEGVGFLAKNTGADTNLLYLSGQHVSQEIPALPHLTVSRVPVYDTRRLTLEKNTIELLYDRHIRWIVLFSRRTAEALAMTIETLARHDWIETTGVVCLSARTAEPMNDLPWRECLIAAEPTAESLTATLPPATLS